MGPRLSPVFHDGVMRDDGDQGERRRYKVPYKPPDAPRFHCEAVPAELELYGRPSCVVCARDVVRERFTGMREAS